MKEILHIAPRHGCKLKCKENPMLVPLLEYAFMEADIIEGGGGVQSHPRLIDDTLYRTSDNVTNMKQARQLVMAMSNPISIFPFLAVTIIHKITKRTQCKQKGTMTRDR